MSSLYTLKSFNACAMALALTTAPMLAVADIDTPTHSQYDIDEPAMHTYLDGDIDDPSMHSYLDGDIDEPTLKARPRIMVHLSNLL